MKELLILLGFMLAIIMQIALGPFLLVFGYVIPLVYIYLWVMRQVVTPVVLLIITFCGGLFMDALVSPLFGVYTVALLLSVYAVLSLNKETKQSDLWRTVAIFLVGGVIYWGVSLLLLSWLA